MLHAFALPALIACLVAHNVRIEPHRLFEIAPPPVPLPALGTVSVVAGAGSGAAPAELPRRLPPPATGARPRPPAGGAGTRPARVPGAAFPGPGHASAAGTLLHRGRDPGALRAGCADGTAAGGLLRPAGPAPGLSARGGWTRVLRPLLVPRHHPHPCRHRAGRRGAGQAALSAAARTQRRRRRLRPAARGAAGDLPRHATVGGRHRARRGDAEFAALSHGEPARGLPRRPDGDAARGRAHPRRQRAGIPTRMAALAQLQRAATQSRHPASHRQRHGGARPAHARAARRWR
ncbi:MAG: hypothetical protein MZW92_38295 [Comamonadaceae bacterium]|nr:hypothetical protein [Comamonadaceae bacterium]